MDCLFFFELTQVRKKKYYTEKGESRQQEQQEKTELY